MRDKEENSATFCHQIKMNIWIAARDATPNIPKNPEMNTVNRLIGTCSPIAPPNTLRKNKNKTPIPSLTMPCPIKRIGFTGAPTNNKMMISATTIEMTTVELKDFNSLDPVLILVCMFKRKHVELQGSHGHEKKTRNLGIFLTLSYESSSFNDNEWH